MTPSQWHDDARNRDAGHDEMQMAVFDFLRDQPDVSEREIGPLQETYVRNGVHFEYPFMRDGKILAWGDVVEVWEAKNSSWPEDMYFEIYEIKPKIYSVGAVVRQCIALEQAALRCGQFNRSTGRRQSVAATVVPVIGVDDPKLHDLQHVHYAVAWDGKRLLGMGKRLA